MKKKDDIKTALDFQKDLFLNLSGNENVIHYFENFQTRFFSFISGSFEDLTGFEIPNSDKITVDFYHSLIHPDDLQLGFEQLNKKIANSNSIKFNIEYIYRLKSKNDDYLWVKDCQTVFLDENKNLSHTIGTVINIDELKNTDIKNQNLIVNYKLLMNLTNLGIFDYHILENTLSINSEWLDFYGYNIQDWVCTIDSFEMMILEKDRVDFNENLKSCFEQSNFKFECGFHFKSQLTGYCCIQMKGKVVEWDENSNPIRFVAVLSDISNNKIKELSLISREQILNKFIGKALFGIVIYDEKGTITEWNESLERISGWQVQDAIGKTFWDMQALLYPNQPNDLYSIEQNKVSVLEFLRTGKLLYPEKPFEKEITRKDGSKCLVKKYFFPIKTDLGYFALGIINDITVEKMLERELSDNENRLREMLEFSKELVYKFNLKADRYEFVSPLIYQMLGYTPEEFYNFDADDLKKLIHKDDLLDYHNVRKIIENDIIKDKVELTVEYRFKNKYGEYRYVSDNYSLIKNYQGEPAYIIGNIRDITESIKQQQMLRDSIGKYKLLVENQNELVVKLDSGFSFLYASPSYCNLFEVKDSEIIGKKFNYHVHSDDIELTDYEIQRVFNEPYSVNYEHRALTKYGWRWLAWSNKAIPNDTHNVESIICVGRDITKRKRIEEMLKRSEKDYRRLFDFGLDAIIIFEPGTEIVLDVNQKACELYGFERDQFIGLSLQEIIVDLPNNRKHISYIFNKQKDYFFEAIHNNFNGSKLYLKIYASLTEYNGRKAILTINRNITEYKIKESKLNESIETVSAVLNIIAEPALIFDADYNVKYTNEKFNEKYGNEINSVKLSKDLNDKLLVKKKKKNTTIVDDADFNCDIEIIVNNDTLKFKNVQIKNINSKNFVLILRNIS